MQNILYKNWIAKSEIIEYFDALWENIYYNKRYVRQKL
jgi:hypothetical protein